MGETNKVNIGDSVNGSTVISGNGNTTIDIKINTTKVSQEKERHVSEENHGGDRKQMNENKEIEFVNRLSELQFMTNSIYGPPYILIDSPKGYGKTRLMKAVKDELEKKQNWLCISIDLREKTFSSIGEMAAYFLTLLNKEDTLHCDLTHPENAGGEVGSCILQKLNQVDKKAVLIQMDTLEKLDRDLINDLLTKFIPTLADTIHQTINRKLKIMFAGRYIAEWKKHCEIPFKVTQLSPFDFNIVHQSVEYFDVSISANINSEYQKDFSAWLMFFTGGHPKSMSEILTKHYRLPMNVINNKEKELYEIVKATINNIKIHIPDELRDIMERISVIRRFNASILNKFIEEKLIQSDEKSEYVLEDLLCQTYLVNRKDGFLQDGITRRLLAIDLCKNNLKLFIRIHKKTVFFYEEKLRNHQTHGRHIIALELLFQRLQYISCKTKKVYIKQFVKYSEDIIKQLILTEDAVSVLDNFKQILEEDWEFRFMLNYLFREVSYDDKPFNVLMKITIDCLENLKKRGKNA